MIFRTDRPLLMSSVSVHSGSPVLGHTFVGQGVNNGDPACHGSCLTPNANEITLHPSGRITVWCCAQLHYNQPPHCLLIPPKCVIIGSFCSLDDLHTILWVMVDHLNSVFRASSLRWGSVKISKGQTKFFLCVGFSFLWPVQTNGVGIYQ